MSRLSLDLSNPNGHVTQYSFGRARRPKGGALDTLYNESPAISPIMAELLLRDAYLTDYGIRPHNVQSHPLDAVRLYDKEDTVEGGAVRSLMRKYLRYNIKEQWGISYSEFKELPYDEVMFMMEISETSMLRNVDSQNRAKRDMEKDIREMKAAKQN